MKFLIWRRRRDLDEEIDRHLQMAAQDQMERGQSATRAQQAARREFGNVDLVREVTREAWGWRWLEDLLQDVRYGLRSLAKNPGFTTVAIFTLALGIGANSAIFSVVNSVLLHSLPFANSDRLMWVWGNFENRATSAALSPADFIDYRAQNHSFEQFSAFFVLGQEPQNLSVRGQSEQVEGTMVTAGFFETFGAEPLLGRTFTRQDEQAKQPQAVILSFRLWQGKFGGDPTIVGSSVVFDGTDVTVAGIMPPSFGYPPKSELWFPTPMLAEGMQQRQAHFLRPVGLLKRGLTQAQANADLDAISPRLAAAYPNADRGWTLRLEPMREVIVGHVQTPLLLLLGAVTLVLLIACVNVANLLLVRGNARQREIAVRTALGARRTRIIRQLLTESIMLSLLGAVAGMVMANGALQLLRSLGPANLPRLDEVQLDFTVLVFTAALALVTGMLFGLAPAVQAVKMNVQDSLKEGSHASAGREKQRLRGALVVSEVALSLTLLVGAGLFLNSLWRMLHVNPGFEPRGVLTARLFLSTKPYADDERSIAFWREFLAKVRNLPGVISVGGVSELPLGGQFNDDFFGTGDRPPKEGHEGEDADLRTVIGDYFQTMRMPLLEGRLFRDTDTKIAPQVLIVDRMFAREYYPKDNALGKRIWLYQGSSGFVRREIIGVVGDVRHFGLQVAPRPTMYIPYSQAPDMHTTLVVRSTGDPAKQGAGLREALASVDPNEALSGTRAMPEIVGESASSSRFNAFLLGIFGALALALAAAGIYGVMSYVVTQRKHEIGVRLALGAQPRSVLGMMVKQGMELVSIGVVCGLALAAGLTHWLAGQLYGVKATDPATFAAVVALLSGVALLACYVPARRAMRVDPMVALRHE